MTRPLIVWHLCSNRWNSAITEYALRSAQALKLQGWHSELSALPSSPCERRAQAYGVQGPSFRFKFSDLLRLRAHAQRLQPSVIITYGGPETFLARFLGVPTVRFRGQDSDISGTLSPLNLWLSLGHCRGILTPAQIVRDRFQKILPTKLVMSIPLGLDTSIFKPRGERSERPTILIVGRLDPVKGHASFFDMFANFLKTSKVHPRPYLQVVGQTSNISADDLHKHASKLGLVQESDYEIIDERVKDLPERMARATLGVIPSLGSEVIGRVAEEFLLSGTPILVTSVGSLKECLIEDSFGSILDSESVVEWLARGYKESYIEREQRAQKAKQAFSLQSMGCQLNGFLSAVNSTQNS